MIPDSERTPAQRYVDLHMPLSWHLFSSLGCTWWLDSGPSTFRIMMEPEVCALQNEENQ